MVSRYIAQYSEIIAENLAAVYIRFPQNDVDRAAVKTLFFQRYRVPGVLSIIDGTHIVITAVPTHMENAYVDRNGDHSVTTQICCDADLRITNINARFPGSTHDSFVYRGSNLNTHLERLYPQDPRTTNFIIGNNTNIVNLFCIYFNASIINYLLLIKKFE